MLQWGLMVIRHIPETLVPLLDRVEYVMAPLAEIQCPSARVPVHSSIALYEQEQGPFVFLENKRQSRGSSRSMHYP